MRTLAVLGTAVLVSTVTAQPDAHSYTCKTTYDKAMEHISHHPMHVAFSRGGHDLAEVVAGWLRDVLGSAEIPMAYAYYANVDDTEEPCTTSTALPYLTNGAGHDVCAMIEYAAGIEQKNLATYLRHILDTACASRSSGCTSHNATLDWNHTAQQTTDLGYKGYNIVNTWRSGCNGIYSPYNHCDSIFDLEIRNALGGQKYYGLGGGGGGGAGFDIYCVTEEGVETRLLGGGGGGGSGVASPERCSVFTAGGGGGGGVDIGADPNAENNTQLGAGAGGDDAGATIGVNPNTTATTFAEQMALSTIAMKRCEANGHNVVIRGGGGGGGGVEANTPFPLNNCSAEPEQTSAFGVGYGFQFVVGKGGHAKLIANASPKEDAYVVCTKDNGRCDACVENATVTSSNPDEKKSTTDSVSDAFRCADAYARGFCAKAHATNGKPYTTYAHYTECNCPVSRHYLHQHLPNDPMWAHVRTGQCVYPPLSPDALPEVSVEFIKQHPHWIPATPVNCSKLVQ